MTRLADTPKHAFKHRGKVWGLAIGNILPMSFDGHVRLQHPLSLAMLEISLYIGQRKV